MIMAKKWEIVSYLNFMVIIHMVINLKQKKVGQSIRFDLNFMLTEGEGRTEECWPEVVAARIKCNQVCTKSTEGQFSSLQSEKAILVSISSHDSQSDFFISNLPAFEVIVHGL